MYINSHTYMHYIDIHCNEKRKFLSNFLNVCKVVIDLICGGREFHSLGPAHSMLLRHSVVRAGGHTRLARLPRVLWACADLKNTVLLVLGICVYNDLNIAKRRKYLCTDRKSSKCNSVNKPAV